MKTWTLLAAALALFCSDAAADVLCKTRSGSLKVRDVCKPTETQADPVALGLQGPPGPQGPAGPAAVVKDSNGTLVGVVTESSGRRVARDISGTPVSIGIAGTTWADEAPQFYYTSTDCSGTAMMYSSTPLRAAYVHSGNLFYTTETTQVLPVGSNSVVLRPGQSCESDSLLPPDRCCTLALTCTARSDCPNVGNPGDFSCTNGYCFSNQYTEGVAPAVTLDLTTLDLVPPFHVEVP